MKIYKLLIISFLLFYFSQNLFSQVDTKNVNVENIDPSTVDPSKIPSAEEMRKQGASEEQIQKALEFKKQAEEKAKKPETKEEKDKTEKDKTEEKKEEELNEEEAEVLRTRAEKSDIGYHIYGQHLFLNKDIKYFQKIANMPPPSNYLLGESDELSVNVWGFSDFSANFRISTDGYISPKGLGRIYLKGLTFASAEALLKKKFGQILDLANSEIEITLIYSRVISVNFIGEVQNPGSYTIPAINTAFNALIAAGGLSKLGSVRSIYIKRRNTIIDSLDVYKFLMDPDKSPDIFLENNDYIFVPPARRVVKIKGSIKRPDTYELKGNENINELLKYCGGLDASAYVTNIQVKRFIDNHVELLDIDLENILRTKTNYKLFDEDEIFIPKIPDAVVNIVIAQGAVNLSGNYELRNGDRISDLLKKTEGVSYHAFTEKAYIVRTNADLSKRYLPFNLADVLTNPNSEQNLQLQRFDVLKVLSKTDFADYFTVTIKGAVRKEGDFEFSEGMKIRDLILLSGGLKERAFTKKGYLVRIEDDLTRSYFTFNIEEIMKNEKSPDNITLNRLDRIRIMSKNEFNDEFSVRVFGAVRTPSEFEYIEGITLSDVLFLCGGVKQQAANERIEVSRVISYDTINHRIFPQRTVVKTIQVNYDLTIPEDARGYLLQPYDYIFVRTNPAYETPRTVTLDGEVLYPGIYSLAKDEKIAEVIERAGGLTEYAYLEGVKMNRRIDKFEADSTINVYLDIAGAIKKRTSRYNIILNDRDIITIPKISNLVHITGSVNPEMNFRSVSVPYVKGKRAKYYINEFAGGFHDNSLKKGTFVKYQNGTYKKAYRLFWIHFYPKVKSGSTVYMVNKPPEKKEEEEKKKSEPIDWTRIMDSSLARMTAVITILILVDKLK